MATDAPRIRVQETAAAGEIVTVRTLVTHEMQSGLRKDKQGNFIPRRIINRFTCTLDEKPLFEALLGPGIAANPYLEFTFRATASGTLRFTWEDDDGSALTAERRIEVA